MGEIAQDIETLDPADTVNDAVAAQQYMSLSGDICLTGNFTAAGNTRIGRNRENNRLAYSFAIDE